MDEFTVKKIMGLFYHTLEMMKILRVDTCRDHDSGYALGLIGSLFLSGAISQEEYDKLSDEIDRVYHS